MRSHFASSLLFLMVASPFFVTYHALPVISFYSEWLAAVFGLLFIGVVLIGRPGAERELNLPRPAAALLVLGAVLLLQWAAGRMSYAEAILLVLLELVWGLLLLMAAARYRDTAGLDKACRTLAAALLLAALANVLVTIIGRAGHIHVLIANFAPGYGYGNLGQRNHFAHLLWLGMAACGYLAAAGRLRWPAALAAALTLAIASGVAGSRSTLVYAGWLGLLAWLTLPTARRRWVPVALALYVLMAWQLPLLFSFGESESPVLRAASDNAPQNAIRLVLLREAWDMFVAHPWLGTGWGGFRAWSFDTGDRSGPWQGGAEHSHNLIANLAGETGIFPALAVVVVLAVWFRGAWARKTGVEHRFLLMAAGVSLFHGMVEYPFWYLFFLGIFLVVLALGDDAPWRLPLRRSLAALLVVAGFGVLGTIGRDYITLEYLVLGGANNHSEAVFAKRLEAILKVRRNSVLAPIADLSLLGVMGPTRDNLEAKQAFCRMSLAYNPSRPGVFNCALVAELAGDSEQADRLWRLSGASPDMPYVRQQREILPPGERRRLSRFLGPADLP